MFECLMCATLCMRMVESRARVRLSLSLAQNQMVHNNLITNSFSVHLQKFAHNLRSFVRCEQRKLSSPQSNGTQYSRCGKFIFIFLKFYSNKSSAPSSCCLSRMRIFCHDAPPSSCQFNLDFCFFCRQQMCLWMYSAHGAFLSLLSPTRRHLSVPWVDTRHDTRHIRTLTYTGVELIKLWKIWFWEINQRQMTANNCAWTKAKARTTDEHFKLTISTQQ